MKTISNNNQKVSNGNQDLITTGSVYRAGIEE